MRESKVETYLRESIELLGGRCDKFTVPARRNVPDRLCTLPNCPMFLVEVKALGELPRDGQWREIYRFRALGVHVYVVDNKYGVKEVMKLETNNWYWRRPYSVAFEDWKERRAII